ncbi:MAG: AAA family ATPase [Chloroflexi bacterium]|nr:AAA family ATPase [Chloroflexota bacterium]
MSTANAYIPIDRQYALAAGQTLPTRTHGAALFADISGFTTLTAELSHAIGEARGAEELMHHLDRVYDALIIQVHRYGGSVIGFSGDAITCWFEGDDTRHAAACAFAIQDAMRQFSAIPIPSRGIVSLTVKIAVSSGPIRRFLVGDPSIQLIDTLAGSTIERLAAAEHLAEKGEVVFDQPTFQSLAPIVRLDEWRTNDSARFAVVAGLSEQVQPQPQLPGASNVLTDEQVRPWLLAPVYNRLKAGQGEFLAELRHTLAFFLMFGGIDYERDDDAGEKLDAFVRWVQQVVTRYEGVLLELIIGDKGSYLYIVFGAPVAHDDDAGRALAAALDLREFPDELNFINPIKIGISQGRMRAGAYGSADRHGYGVQGDEVNLAARLMEHAVPGQILVTERVTNAVGNKYHFTPLGAIHVKGKQDAINVFQLIEREERQPRPVTPTAMIGRTIERALLSEKLKILRGQKISSVVVIEGDAGIGKTRLIEHLRQETQMLSATILMGVGDEIEKSTPYYAWRFVFAQLFKLDALPEDKATRRAYILSELESTLPLHLVRLAPLLKAVIPLDVPENDLTEQMSGQVRADNTHLLLTQIIQHLARAWPLVLVIEDAQWLDSASWSLAHQVAREVSPILLVIATRPLSEPIPSEYRNLLADEETIKLALVPLPIDEISALVSQRLGVKTVPHSVTELITEKAEGNPLFAEELAYALRDGGLILISGELCRIAPNVDLNAVTFPDAVQDLVTSRIDQLVPAQQLSLKVASVIGRIFPYHILHDSFPIDQERNAIPAHLNTLERLDFTALWTREPELVYAFKHFITQQVSYSLLLFSQRRELHRAVAEWYENHQADDLSAYYPLLAHHWGNAEEPAKTIEYLEKAGEQALHNFANEEAAAFFERALTLVDQGTLQVDSLRRARWDLYAGEAYVNLSNYVEGRKHLEIGLARLDQPVPSATAGQITHALRQAIRQVLHRTSPSRYIGRAKDKKETLLILARSYERLSEATYFLGETLIPVYSAFRGLNLAEAAGPSPEAGRSSAAVGALLGFIPLHGMARGYLDRARAIVRETDHLESREFISMTSSYYYSGVGDWAQVIEQAEQVLTLAKHLGDERRWQDVTSHIVSVRYFQGDFAASAKLADELYATASRRRDSRFMALALQAQALCDLYRGEFDEAMRRLQSLKSLVAEGDQIAVLPLKIETLGLLSLTHLRRSEHEEALSTADQGLTLTTKSMPSFYAAITGYAGPAEVYLTLWENQFRTPNIAKRAHQAVQTLAKYAHVFPIGAARFYLDQGRYHWLTNKPSQAHKAWQTSLHHAERLGMLYDQGLIHYEIARHLATTDPARQEHRSRALEIFAHVKAAYDLARMETL